MIMRRINACVAIVGFAVVIFSTLPAAAFTIRVGPYRFTFPLYWHRHHKHYAEPAPDSLAPAYSKRGNAAVLFYPQLALPAIYASIFSPAYASPWSFDYQTILSTAFAKLQPQPDSHLCQPQSDIGTKIIAPIRTALALTDAQIQLLEKLGGALGAAADDLEKSCAVVIPGQPIARVQLMGSRIKVLAMAIDTIRNPLQDFSQSLNDEQRARFAAMIAAPTDADGDNGSGNIASRCAGMSSTVDRLLGQIDKSVQPINSQRDALADLKRALEGAASDLMPLCQTPAPPTAFSRLETIEAQLDAIGRAASSTQVALANFEAKLGTEQKDRFNAMNLVGAGTF